VRRRAKRPSEGAFLEKRYCLGFDGFVLLPLSQQEWWYVARTLPQRELQAAKQLANQDVRAFVPRHWKNRRHARRVETISAPLFPRYSFVVLDRSRDRWRSINGTLGGRSSADAGRRAPAGAARRGGEPRRFHRRRRHYRFSLLIKGGPNPQSHSGPIR
jgi:Transcription termination factor nusG